MWMEARDELNRVILDGDVRVSRCLGAIDCDPNGGSISDSNLAQGKAWAVVIPVEGYSAFDVVATATISGTTISYTFSKKRCRLLYGTY